MHKNMEKFQDYWKIDSCSLTFKVSDLISYDKRIHDEWILVNTTTGEPMEGFVRKDYQKIELNGVRFDVKFYAIQNPKTKLTTKYVNIIVYSRHLYDDYFQGITDFNLFHLYSNIMDTGLINCTFQVFCEAKVSQPDFCIDSKATNEQIELVANQLDKLRTERSEFKTFKIGGQIHSYQFGKRKLGKKIAYSYAKPFFKLYSKYEDANSKDRKHVKEFYSKIGVNINDLKDYYRFEMSIKDKVHLNHYLKRYTDKTYKMNLLDLCRMMEDVVLMSQIRVDMLERNMKKAIRIEEQSEEKQNVLDKVLKNIVKEVVENSEMNISETIDYIMNTFLMGISSNKKTIYNYKNKVAKIVQTEHIKQMKKLNKDGLAGILKDKGAVELVGHKYDFNEVIARLIL